MTLSEARSHFYQDQRFGRTGAVAAIARLNEILANSSEPFRHNSQALQGRTRY